MNNLQIRTSKGEQLAKTSIVATIGPASESRTALKQLLNAGMSIARLNGSHGTLESHAGIVRKIRALSPKIPILLDLPGSKIRLGRIEKPISIAKGSTFIFTTKQNIDSPSRVSILDSTLHKKLKQGDRILLDDATFEFKVTAINGKDITCRSITPGILSSHKGLNVPHVKIIGQKLTEKDKKLIRFARQQALDYVGMSFVRTRDDIKQVQKELGTPDVKVIAKIETQDALDNFNAIIREADGIMIDRGDLGAEIGLENVPIAQKEIIKKANQAGKPVITATQMMHSLIENTTPTRAEVSDLANAIIDGTNAVMLSGETAVGKNPANAVRTMAKIIGNTEKNLKVADSRPDKRSRRIPSVKEIEKLCLKPRDCIIMRQYRYLSVHITRQLIKLNATPNQVTISSILLGIASVPFFWLGTWPNLIIAAVLLQLAFLLDCVDGELARWIGLDGGIAVVKGFKSGWGAWLDSVGDFLTGSLTYAAASIGVYVVTGNAFAMIVGFFAVNSVLMISFISTTRRFITINEPEGVKRKGKPDVNLGSYYFLGITSTYTTLLTLGAVFNQVYIALWIMAVLGTAMWLKQIYNAYQIE